MTFRACHGLGYGLAGITWYIVWPGGHAGYMVGPSGHSIWYGLVGIAWYYGMAWRAWHGLEWPGGQRMVYGMA